MVASSTRVVFLGLRPRLVYVGPLALGVGSVVGMVFPTHDDEAVMNGSPGFLGWVAVRHPPLSRCEGLVDAVAVVVENPTVVGGVEFAERVGSGGEDVGAAVVVHVEDDVAGLIDEVDAVVDAGAARVVFGFVESSEDEAVVDVSWRDACVAEGCDEPVVGIFDFNQTLATSCSGDAERVTAGELKYISACGAKERRAVSWGWMA